MALRKVVVVLCLCLGVVQANAQVLWFEDFEGEADGATTGTATGGTWTATYGGAGTFSKQSPLGINLFRAQNTITEGVWTMDAPVSIAATGRAIAEVTVVGLLVGAGDYIRCYYRVDGGPETLFFEQVGGLVNFTLTGTAIVTGSNLQIVIRASVNGDFAGLDRFSFDDVRITGINTLYSRKSGNWNDVTAGNGTWSVAALGGASCDCSPIATDYVIVGNGNTVDLNVSGTAGGLEVRNTSSVRYTANSVELNIDRGILQVDAGGSIDRNGQTGVQIDFDRGVITTFLNNGTITTETIEVTAANAYIAITGSGSISLTQDFNILQDDIVVDNDLAGSFTIGDDLVFDQTGDILSDDAQFINRRTLTITSDIVVGANNDDGNTFTNAAGAVVQVVAINANDADFIVSNSGTITQTGDFLNIVGTSSFDNLATGTWNWNFVQAGFDAQMATALDCSAAGNTFVYGAAGNQSMIAVAYHHLTAANSGTKATTNNLDVNGDLAITGTARLDPNTGNDNITLAGNWTVTSTNADPFDQGTETVTLDGTLNAQTISTVLAGGETFNNLTLNNTFATAPQFILSSNVTVSSVLTMTAGRTNLNGQTFSITSTAAGALVHGFTSANGWMYGGNLARGTVATGIGVGTIRGFYPVGSATNFRPLYFGKPGGTTAGTTTVTHNFASETTSVVSFADDLTITRRHDTFWTIVTTCTGGAASWSLRAGGTGFGTIQEITDLRLSTSAGITGTPGVNLGTTADPLVERLGISIANLNANNFHIASVDEVNTPLPIELLSFTAVAVQEGVRLSWATASETDNDYFTIERSATGEAFEAVATLKGRGTTTSTSNYELLDTQPIQGASYYRLRQTDFNGVFTFSPIERVTVNRAPAFSVYPNPATEGISTVRVSGFPAGEEVEVVILDAMGRVAATTRGQTNTSGEWKTDWRPSVAAAGVYLFQVRSLTLQQVVRVVIP